MTDEEAASLFAYSSDPTHIALGYIMTLTDAPNDCGGRLCLKDARTTPELPADQVRTMRCNASTCLTNRVWTGSCPR